MRVEWSVSALEDRNGIFDYIEEDSPRAAVIVDDRIGWQIGRLVEFPQSGRPGRVDGTRELVISGTPFIAAYRVTDRAVRILRVLHGSRQWPDEIDH